MPTSTHQPPAFAHERIASRCVCCGSAAIAKSPAIVMPFVAHRAFGWAPVRIDESWGLKTIAQGMAYTVCNSVGCSDCGFVFLDIRFSGSELAALYEGYRGPGYNALRESYEPGYTERSKVMELEVPYLAQIDSFLAPFLPAHPAVLDWGGNTGLNTPFKGSRALHHIYDIGSKPVMPGAQRVDKATAASTHYDLVVCSNVIEHVPYPSELLMEMKQTMGPQTMLYLETPYEDLMRQSPGSRELYLRKKHWHEHINFFSKESLLRLLDGCGFDIAATHELQATAGGNSQVLFQIACRARP